MSIVVPDLGEQRMLERVLSDNVIYKLYVNDLDPADGSHGADGEDVPDAGTPGGPVECTTPGYAPITVSGGSWTISTSGGETSAVNNTITFTMSTATDVYGYYVEEPGVGTLWIERFSGPIGIADGGQLELIPSINCK